ncbi:MAG: HAMP domain-containing protein, partial [Candidatus Marithrix sp.]|nr:HAMP domain-containing protein [Candidatus Marithrix sp.]
MNFSLFQSMRSKLIVLFLIVALLPLLIVGMLLYNQSHNLLTEEITNRLSTILDIKTQQIQAYFTRAVNDINLLAQNPTTIEATQAFEELNHTNIEAGGITDYRTKYLNQPDSIANPNAYDKIHSKYHAIFAKYKKVYGYYDIFIIEPHTGYILYTVEKENDFGTSLVNGPYANTNLSQVFKAVVDTKDKDFTSLEDFSYYAPSQSVASFIAAPIFNASKLIGVIVLQLSTNKIDSIMQANNGLGDNGETVLIGANDFLLRSNSRFAQDSLFKMKWDNQASRTKGETGIKKIIDDNDKTMLVAYAPLKISGLNWSLHAKIDWNEAVSGMQFMQLWSIFIVGVSIIIIISIAILVSNSFISPIKAITDAANKLTAGNMTISLDIERKDEIGQLAQSFQQMANDMSKIIADIVQVSHGLAKGDLNVVTKEEYHGDFIQIKQSLEEALHSLCAVIKDIVLVSKELANGNLNTIPQIDEYHGDFIQIQTALTVALSNKRKVIEDIVYVSEKLLLGEFNYTS